MLQDLQQLKAPPDVIERYQQDQEDCWVLPENWDAVMLLVRCDTQRNIGPQGQLIGLNYAGVEVVMKRMQIKHKNRVFAQLQQMEKILINAVNID